MAIKKITYFVDGKKKRVEAKICDNLWLKFSGLMFRKNSLPLLFVFNRNGRLAIHSFFCRPFRAVWLDEEWNAVKVVDVKKWRPNISGRGKYLLEIPFL